MKKEDFVMEFKDSIETWAKLNQNELLNFRSYRWKNRTYDESARARNYLERRIELSRLSNFGGIDLATADAIFTWGFDKPFPLRDNNETVNATKEAFEFLDKCDCYRACRRLMQVYGIGVAGATKILGLSNQEKYCIYDSRVGKALEDLRKDGQKIIRCPPGRTIEGDFVPYEKWDVEWSKDYQKLIWTLEVIQGFLKENGHVLRIGDFEMALFMKGRRR